MASTNFVLFDLPRKSRSKKAEEAVRWPEEKRS
jgi:hypothetical protein